MGAMEHWAIILDSVSIRFPNGWEITVPAWTICIAAIGLFSALGALAIWGLVRRVNHRSAKLPPDRP
jgi:hypothetical protein